MWWGLRTLFRVPFPSTVIHLIVYISMDSFSLHSGSEPATQSVILHYSTIPRIDMASDTGPFCGTLPRPSLWARVRVHVPACVGARVCRCRG